AARASLRARLTACPIVRVLVPVDTSSNTAVMTLTRLHPTVECCCLSFDQCVAFGVGEVKLVTQADRIGGVDDLVAQIGSELFAFCCDFFEESISVIEATAQVLLGAHHWVGLGVF